MARSLAILASLVLGAAPAFADGDPPAVVGRIAEVAGAVSYKGAAAPDWANAERNWPVVAGDAVYAAEGGRAQVEIGAATLTLPAGGEVDFVTLDDKAIVTRADLGEIDVRIAPGPDGLTMATPRGRVALGPDGLYRIAAGGADAPTEITVWRGGASFEDGRTRIRPGELLRLTGDPAAPETAVAAAPPVPADLAPFAAPATAAAPLAPRRVSSRIAGIRDLDRHGRWASSAAYGEVWYPTDVAAGWAPYRYGRWRWVAPWGWTWVDDASWGFAPFHYGRWVALDGRWAWAPGTYVERPVYAPALVAFIDPPPRVFAVAVAGPVVGWVPLGPGDLFRPYYGYGGPTYFRQVNVNIVNVNAPPPAPMNAGAFQNAAAATIVPAASVSGSAPVGPAALPVQTAALTAAPVTAAGAPPAAVAAPSPAAATASRAVVAVPPRVAPILAGAAVGAGAAALAARAATAPTPAGPAASRPAGLASAPPAPPPPATATRAAVATPPTGPAATPATTSPAAQSAAAARPGTASPPAASTPGSQPAAAARAATAPAATQAPVRAAAVAQPNAGATARPPGTAAAASAAARPTPAATRAVARPTRTASAPQRIDPMPRPGPGLSPVPRQPRPAMAARPRPQRLARGPKPGGDRPKRPHR